MPELNRDETRTPIIVESIGASKYQKANSLTATLRQTLKVEVDYPAAVRENELQRNPFSSEDFGDEPIHRSFESDRVAFVDVPVNSTVESVTATLKPDHTLYRILSNSPIMAQGHRDAINSGATTKAKIAEGQLVRYPEGDEKAGRPILDNQGRVQYRKVFYWDSPKDDVDLRGKENHPEYRYPALEQELTVDSDGVVAVAEEAVLEVQEVTDESQTVKTDD